MQIKSPKDLILYQKAYALAMRVFELSKNFPTEEKYSLTDQIRRSSRSVCTNIREAWSKRRYEAHFVSKLTDADGENSETQAWLDFALDCQYLSKDEHSRLSQQQYEIGAILGKLIREPKAFVKNTDR